MNLFTKRFLSILLVVLMVVTAIPTTVFAADNETNDIRGLNTEIEINQFIEIPNQYSDIIEYVQPSIRSIECKVVNERKVLVTVMGECNVELESNQVREDMAIYETNDGQRITSVEGRANILEDTLTAVVSSLDAIKGGLLAVQGHEFRSKCRRLLEKDVIKPSEYEQLESDHNAYNGLGGNHKGDSLFDQVKTKYYA